MLLRGERSTIIQLFVEHALPFAYSRVPDPTNKFEIFQADDCRVLTLEERETMGIELARGCVAAQTRRWNSWVHGVVPMALALLLASAGVAKANEDEKDDAKISDFESTHVQIGSIDICSADGTLGLNAFCLDSSGNILAAVGKSTNAYGPQEEDEKLEAGVRVFNPAGEMLDYWPLTFTPQAIGYGDDEFVYVGGEGKLAKLDRSGKVLSVVDAPNLANREAMMEAARQQLVRSQEQAVKTYQQMIERLEERNAPLEAKSNDGELTEGESRRLDQNRKLIARYESVLEAQQAREVDESTIEAMIKSKSRISSISHAGENVFVACAASEGYGFEVWKMDSDFKNGKSIVQGLRGCCGQMDVQVNGQGLFVAENAGHRVVRYDLDGKEVGTFGKRDAKGTDGFGSCCNPMNLCFDGQDHVLTAESGTGRILKFDAEGKPLAMIGAAQITGGCKNVAVHATADLDKVYLLDLTGKKICVLQRKSEE